MHNFLKKVLKKLLTIYSNTKYLPKDQLKNLIVKHQQKINSF